MIKLYNCFNHWNQNGKIWIYSDFHFTGAELDQDAIAMRKIFNYGSNELQIANINKKVFKQDCLICLGDIGDPKDLSKLKVKFKVLIMGNHDRNPEYYKDYFNEIYDGPVFIHHKILLSHIPLHNDNWFNFHGHLHNFNEIDNNPLHNTYYCCSANLNNYEPVCLSDFIKHEGQFQGNKGLLNIKSGIRETIDKAIERKRKKLSEFHCN